MRTRRLTTRLILFVKFDTIVETVRVKKRGKNIYPKLALTTLVGESLHCIELYASSRPMIVEKKKISQTRLRLCAVVENVAEAAHGELQHEGVGLQHADHGRQLLRLGVARHEARHEEVKVRPEESPA